ncbi:hypothetical protein BDM02DRAFT_1449884 [Thelephora ganbajun]|uniref:Uncharacterized protein n=1 Tax=Thelephora ganbajun TaxID=370292 RepID=A0ACB6ZKV0_THEGA|nr:hypothetical protein BDM02DRAFT_1449884 [Thelephora ganbajun]
MRLEGIEMAGVHARQLEREKWKDGEENGERSPGCRENNKQNVKQRNRQEPPFFVYPSTVHRYTTQRGYTRQKPAAARRTKRLRRVELGVTAASRLGGPNTSGLGIVFIVRWWVIVILSPALCRTRSISIVIRSHINQDRLLFRKWSSSSRSLRTLWRLRWTLHSNGSSPRKG